jgi:hypothetical protein
MSVEKNSLPELELKAGKSLNKKQTSIEIVTESGLKIKLEKENINLFFISGKFFRVLSIQKTFDNLVELEISTNLSLEFVRGILFVFGYSVFEIFDNEFNVVAVVGGE